MMESFVSSLVWRCCLAVLLCYLVAEGGQLDFLRFPDHDGVSRVCKLTRDNFTTVTGEGQKTTVVFFVQSREADKCISGQENDAEVLGQVLQNTGIRICLASNDFREGQEELAIYNGGKKMSYFGLRSAASVLSFLRKLESSRVRIITGKLDKVAFDAVQEPKLVGLFMNGTPDFKAYEEASILSNPAVHFYAVFDRTVAKHLRLDVVGEIHLYKPMQKTPVVCPVNPATSADLQTFIQGQEAVFTRLTEHNINDPAVSDPSRLLVMAIAEQTSPLGGYLYRLLTKTIRNNTNNTDFSKLNVLWVEPDLFPAIYLNARTPIGGSTLIPDTFPSLGSVNGSSSVWFDMAQLNGTADKLADEQNMALIKSWLDAVLSNTAISSSGLQSFIIQPLSQTVTEGSDFILQCKVQNPVGDCMWLHNGQNIGFNMDRYGGLYSWVVPRNDASAAGDCSLKVTGAQLGRQDGDWVCEMTGNDVSPNITSRSAKITVTPRGDSKTEL